MVGGNKINESINKNNAFLSLQPMSCSVLNNSWISDISQPGEDSIERSTVIEKNVV